MNKFTNKYDMFVLEKRRKRQRKRMQVIILFLKLFLMIGYLIVAINCRSYFINVSYMNMMLIMRTK